MHSDACCSEPAEKFLDFSVRYRSLEMTKGFLGSLPLSRNDLLCHPEPAEGSVILSDQRESNGYVMLSDQRESKHLDFSLSFEMTKRFLGSLPLSRNGNIISPQGSKWHEIFSVFNGVQLKLELSMCGKFVQN